jgi:RecJ-like exonuclease
MCRRVVAKALLAETPNCGAFLDIFGKLIKSREAMKTKFTVTLFAILCAASVVAQTTPTYTAQDAIKHIGETAVVTGKVDDVYQAKGGSIFLNIGGKHPNELFTAFIPSKNAGEFTDFKSYKGAVVAIEGIIEDHDDKPQIVVNAPSQITIKEKAAAKGKGD